MTKRTWESSPWMWFGVVVVAGVTTAVVSSALQKWWGLKLAQQILSQKNIVLAGFPAGNNRGKYTAVY